MAKKQKPTFGAPFWIGLILLVAVVYIAYRIDLQTLIAKSGVTETVKKSFGGDYRTSPGANPPELPSAPRKEEPYRIESPKPSRESQPAETKKTDEVKDATPAPSAPKKEREEPAARPQTVEKTRPQPKPAAKPQDEAPKYRDARLYFVRLGEDGKIQYVPVMRKVLAVTSPLTDLMDELLAGPRPDEKKKGLVSLVPAGTKLLSAVVKDDIAHLNFNEAFRFNAYGKEGLTGQVGQLVLSVTEIGQVKKVQILIDGEVLDYLSPEGIFIGKPLGRDSF